MWGLWHVNSSLQLRSFQAVRHSGENELQQQKVWGIVRAHGLPQAGLASRLCLVKRLPPLVVCKLFASCWNLIRLGFLSTKPLMKTNHACFVSAAVSPRKSAPLGRVSPPDVAAPLWLTARGWLCRRPGGQRQVGGYLQWAHEA